MTDSIRDLPQQTRLNVRGVAASILLPVLINRLDKMHPGLTDELAKDAETFLDLAMSQAPETPPEIQAELRHAVRSMLAKDI